MSLEQWTVLFVLPLAILMVALCGIVILKRKG